MRARESGRSLSGKANEASGHTHEGCCRMDIRIKSEGDVNIYNCTEVSPGGEPSPTPTPRPECPTGPIAPGQCVPLSIGSKPKQGQRDKLNALLQNTRVPSAIAGAFFHHSRRFIAGKAAANSLEKEV